MQFFSIYGDICTIYLFFMIFCFALSPLGRSFRRTTNNGIWRWLDILACTASGYRRRDSEFNQPTLNFYLVRQEKVFIIRRRRKISFKFFFSTPLINKLSCRLKYRKSFLLVSPNKNFSQLFFRFHQQA